MKILTGLNNDLPGPRTLKLMRPPSLPDLPGPPPPDRPPDLPGPPLDLPGYIFEIF